MCFQSNISTLYLMCFQSNMAVSVVYDHRSRN